MNTEPYKLHPVISSNLREQIEREIRSAIIEGRYKPGERMVESAIAVELGVSRAPVREALSALEREGLVINIPRRGSFIVDLTEKDIKEIYSFRLLLETGALEFAFERVNEEDFENLQQLIDDLNDAINQKVDLESILNLDLFFHDYLCSLANHRRLYAAWKSIRLQTQMLMGYISSTFEQFPHEPAVWHQSILDAMIENDIETAKTILTEHIYDAKVRALKAVEDRPSLEEK
ncbi:MAG: GntR family transcriptional regulator [Anaerolineaceae bacterium]|nr:GntR family transcriptional regulator [Anaerolineaceae bacterium]